MRLYHHPVSSNARRVMLAAIHMGTPLETTEVNLMDPADRRRLEELNPNSKVPVLQDGDFVLWESCAIMQYLAERTYGQTLYPDNVVRRADINRWMFWACQHFSPALSIIVWENIWKGLTGNGGPDPVEVARGAEEVKQFATVLDNHLAGRQWVVGDSLTLADFALAAPLMYTEQAKLPVTEYINLQAWYARVQELDAWKQTQPVW
jgi:glutathione S-transferase